MDLAEDDFYGSRPTQLFNNAFTQIKLEKVYSMPPGKGMIVLMGSGELTATMVEVHKEILARTAAAPKAVFLDTPAGFQLNVDQISQKAQEYFQAHVQHALAVASFKSHAAITPYEAEQAYHSLRAADFVLIGPGSPTYAVRQWQQTSIPEILINRIRAGACLVAASAAALTVGRFTLPVYEIYTVGHELHWVDGMDVLKHFGFNLVVVPHWNNAEGGNHDTRFCFMGRPRFSQLVSLLPEDVSILGLDEHTACILDFENDEAVVKGIGSVTLQRSGSELVLIPANGFPLKYSAAEMAAKNGNKKRPGRRIQKRTCRSKTALSGTKFISLKPIFIMGLRPTRPKKPPMPFLNSIE